MRDLATELKALRLYGMAAAWAGLTAQGESARVDAARWLVEHLLDEEQTDRALRSISHQMHAARFPVHRDLAGFDFAQSKVDRGLITELADLAFTAAAHNVVFIGGTGTGKTHLATALGIAGITRQSKRVRFYSTIDLVNLLEQERKRARPGGSPSRCCAWIWSSSTNSATCHSARPVARCCSTCCRSYTSTPA